ncbi:GntR family phosphonate transport system transcriptional regulator [Pseudochelatococcus lubricantis]|uniref:GntR family phosphonate transport system transcriptional regulator n=1 Tax=Pseudochelatococcus lubricantis TaxID=1538102 RepID=A0ABX0V1Y3_9HYPH|nr:phosphonate metabolism transcriptional regulator PhnF [Pseudochelatococcus lubricantis]NIJ58947.1 GntR family phosphonate transport system transcriptional regulator [Pseudochelatococcus lubricantis]
MEATRHMEATYKLVRNGRDVPVWRQIETDIEVDIQMGVFGPGDRLPSEHELAAKFGVNRHTVRQALAGLAEKGLVHAQRGRGVFVADEPVDYTLDRNAKWSEVEKRFDGGGGEAVLHDCRELPATRQVARALRIAPGTPLIATETLRRAGPGIGTYGYHLFPKVRFDGIDREFVRHASFTKAIAACGVAEFFRRSTWISCRMPRPREAEALAIPATIPVIVMTYVDTDAEDAPILYGHGVFPRHLIRIRIDT